MSSRTKMLVITTEWLSAQTFLTDQLGFYSGKGLEVHLACSLGSAGDSSIVQLERFQLHQVEMKRTAAGLSDARALWALVALIREVKPHVLVASTPKASLLGLAAGYLCRSPVRIYWCWGLRSETQSGLAKWVSRTAERACVSLATHILTVGPSLTDKLLTDIPTARPKVTLLGHGHANGVDLEGLTPSSSKRRHEARRLFGIPQGAKVVGFMGRLNLDKGIGYLHEAMEEIIKDFPEAKLLQAGAVDTNHAFLPDQWSPNGSKFVIAPGFQHDRQAFFDAIDVFCMPSLREGLSTANLEAAACGLPVITTSATGCIDSIVDGKTGLVVSAHNAPELADAIASIFLSPKLAEALGRAGKAWVSTRFRNKDIWDKNLRYFLESAGRL